MQESSTIDKGLSDQTLFRQECFIGGRWIGLGERGEIKTLDPGSGAILGSVPDAGSSGARNAIAAASEALKSWSALTARERSGMLRRWYELIIQNRDDLATILTLEQGKPLAEAKGEIGIAADYVLWFAEEAKRVYGETIQSPWPDRRLLVLRQPVGVCAAITPWNFPSSMVTRKVAPALAAGCTVVLKPAEQTPHSALALAELGARAGLPGGAFNVVTGDPATIGLELCQSEVVRKLSFTGSTEVGRILMAQVASTVKKLSLELGGNAPFIVFDDAELEAAVEGAIVSKYRNAGQTCVSANRIFVQSSIYDAFVERLTSKIQTLRVGPGMSPTSEIGPLIDDQALTKVRAHIDDALLKGARVLTGGHSHSLGGGFFEPTVIADATERMAIFSEETFSPVAPIFRFGTEQEVVDLANRTEYGLASYFYSRDIGRIWRVLEALQYGMVGVNSGLITTEVAPFGGVKHSGVGREGGRQGIEEYLEFKYVCMGGLSSELSQ